MKRIIFLFITLAHLSCHAQESKTAFRHANTIMLDTDVGIKQIIASLQNYGFVVDSYDLEIGTIKTVPFKIWRSSGQTGTIHIWRSGSKVMVSGFAFTSIFGMSTTQKMEKRGTGNMCGKLFETVNELAVKLAKEYNAKIIYLKL